MVHRSYSESRIIGGSREECPHTENCFFGICRRDDALAEGKKIPLSAKMKHLVGFQLPRFRK